MTFANSGSSFLLGVLARNANGFTGANAKSVAIQLECPGMSGPVVAVGPTRGRTRWTSLSVARSLVLGLAAMVGCTDPFGPDRIENVRPTLRSLSFDHLNIGRSDGGILILYATPSDYTFSLEPGQRVPLEISATSGDRDSVGLYNVACPSRERLPGHVPCFDLTLGMREGHDPTEFADQLRAAGGWYVSIHPAFATVLFFSPDDPIGRAKRARSWPGVAYAEFWGRACGIPEGCAPFPTLEVPVRVVPGAAVPGDGIVQVRSGDTVSVTYRQPRVGVLTLQLQVP